MINRAIEMERGKGDGDKHSMVPKGKAVRKGGKQGGEEERVKEESKPEY